MKKVLLVLAIVGMFVMPMMPVKVKADNTTLATHYWHDKKLIWWMWSVAKYANDESLDIGLRAEINHKTIYRWLNIYFDGCSSMRSFYNRVQELCGDAWKNGVNDPPSELDMNKKSLYDIMKTIINDNDPPTYLFCHQQAILFAAAVKARYSEWNGERYVLKSGYNDFIFYFNVKFENNPLGHIQLVIDKWNGQDWFYYKGKWYNKWEADTWENQYRPWNKDEGWKDNSKMWTDTSSSTASTDEKINEEYNWTEIENVISISGDNQWYEFWIEDNLINDYYNYLRENEK
ncbi:MAG: hypothetical protein J7L58_07530 [Thermoplasmata archaeon]|nr:hypothetical protein [Thermoplasmata archaeon]